jgi:hypothetical protein
MKRWHSFQIPNIMPRHYALHVGQNQAEVTSSILRVT